MISTNLSKFGSYSIVTENVQILLAMYDVAQGRSEFQTGRLHDDAVLSVFAFR